MGMATIPPRTKEMEDQFKPVDVPDYIWNCPVCFDWCVFKGETYFGMINYERSIKARRPMIDLAYCATRGLNNVVLKTVAYSAKNFSKSHLAIS